MNQVELIKPNSRQRFDLLDGLRGVAAVLVIWYHFFEGFATTPVDQMMNHGYLAVDFFFVLSGFVLGYSYMGRFRPEGSMTWRGFMLRRIIRLHPMVVLSIFLGVISYVIQGCVRWDGTLVAPHLVVIALIAGLFLVPLWNGVESDIRGNGEMFPINGPSWSLFFEYIGSFMFALFLRKLSTRWLAIVVAIAGIALGTAAVTNLSGSYHIGFGWSIEDGWGFLGGFLRLSYSFGMGLLLNRIFHRRQVRGAFWICAMALIIVLACPYVTQTGEVSVANGVYDALCTLLLLPALVYIGACGLTTDRLSTTICEFLGRISYPVYIVHYPVMYMFYAWVWANGYSFSEVWPICVTLFVGIILLSCCAMRFYDEPIRKALTRYFMKNR